jgi:hypothetical protein
MQNRFFRFSHSAAILGPFIKRHSCGWFDGGCFIFARGLQLWLGGRLTVIVRQELAHQPTFDHVLLSLPDRQGVNETLYVDADGVTTATPLLECWRTRERLPSALLEDPGDPCRFGSPLRNECLSHWLAERFRSEFGTPGRSKISILLGRSQTCVTRTSCFRSSPGTIDHLWERVSSLSPSPVRQRILDCSRFSN